ncbi:hypothetical protein YTPLAS18_27150 [Nitrospira sp.]|nr:hypothetical protein YTPLAS18_27150 [Nitrospira sp.]
MEISRHGRIDDLGKLLLGVQAPDRSPQRHTVNPQTPSGDRVEISDAAKELQRGRELAQADDGARSEKVARLKEAVDNGTYTVTGRTVADKLLRHTLIESVL